MFTVLCRVESGAWYRKLAAWQEQWVPPGVHGVRPGHECLSSAWPAQARLEEAMLSNQDRAAVTLVCTKLFDRFDADFYTAMLQTIGYPSGLAKIQQAIYADFVRHIKIAV